MKFHAKFVLPGVPPTATAQQKGAFVIPGTNRIRFYTKKEVRQAENTWHAMLLPHRHESGATIEGPVALGILMVFPYTASLPKLVTAAGRYVPLDKRPDIDNLIKSLLDTMTQMQFWRDDGQLYGATLYKFRGAEPRTEITVWLPDEESLPMPPPPSECDGQGLLEGLF